MITPPFAIGAFTAGGPTPGAGALRWRLPWEPVLCLEVLRLGGAMDEQLELVMSEVSEVSEGPVRGILKPKEDFSHLLSCFGLT